MTLQNAIRQSWSPKTTREWKPENPAWGQCAVTALLVQDELGGTLLRGEVPGIGSHYFNRLPDGTELDLTRCQFPEPVTVSNVQERSREYVLSFPDTLHRYTLLRQQYRKLCAWSQHLVPVSMKQANAFVAEKHRHHGPVVGFKFAIGLADTDGTLLGVAIAGRPVARRLDNGTTLEVTRLCTDGSRNACSRLYAAVARAAREMGYRKVITYTLQTEPGTSLKATGWEQTVESPGKSWDVPTRRRKDKHQLGPRLRWEKELAA